MGIKVFAPVVLHTEVRPLADGGADELYGGIVPPEWRDRHGYAFALNRRETAWSNSDSYEEMGAVVREAHDAGLTVHLALNEGYYQDEHYDLLRRIATKLAKLGVDAFIVGDIGLMLALREWDLGVALDVSCIGMAWNVEAVGLYAELGARRIIFPRDVLYEEVRAVTRAFPDLEYEAFSYADPCFFYDGLCTTLHMPTRKKLCHMTIETGYFVPRTRLEDSAQRIREGNRTLDFYDPAPLKQGRGPAGATTTAACGLCGLRPLARAGVGSFKQCGRTLPLPARLAHLELLRGAVAIAESDLDDATAYRKTMELRAAHLGYGDPVSAALEVEQCMMGAMCYYPDDPRLVALREAYWQRRTREDPFPSVAESSR